MLVQPNPVSGTPYGIGVLGVAVEDVRIIGIGVAVTWTVQPTPLEARIIVDGVTYNFNQANPASGNFYVVIGFFPYVLEASQLLVVGQQTNGYLLEGHSVQVLMETTGGTTSQLEGRVIWERLLPT